MTALRATPSCQYQRTGQHFVPASSVAAQIERSEIQESHTRIPLTLNPGYTRHLSLLTTVDANELRTVQPEPTAGDPLEGEALALLRIGLAVDTQPVPVEQPARILSRV